MASQPRPTDPNQVLQREAQWALKSLGRSNQSLTQDVKEATEPKRWFNRYPWTTSLLMVASVTAVGVGIYTFFRPRREQKMVVVDRRKKSRWSGVAGRYAFKTAKTLVTSSLSAAVAAKQAKAAVTDAPPEAEPPEMPSA